MAPKKIWTAEKREELEKKILRKRNGASKYWFWPINIAKSEELLGALPSGCHNRGLDPSPHPFMVHDKLLKSQISQKFLHFVLCAQTTTQQNFDAISRIGILGRLRVINPLFFLWMHKFQLELTFMSPTRYTSIYSPKYLMQSHWQYSVSVATKHQNIPIKHSNSRIPTC